jgi:hypothetical protein
VGNPYWCRPHDGTHMIFLSLLRSMGGQSERRGTAMAHALHMPGHTLMLMGVMYLLVMSR